MAEYLIVHDLTPYADSACLYNRDGELVDKKTASFETYSPQSGWFEQEPNDWWQAVCRSSKELMVGRKSNEIVGITFSGQSQCCLCLDKNFKPLMNSIIYTDSRAVKECAALTASFGGERICAITGQQLSPNFTLSKLMWVKANRPEVYEKTAVAVQAKDYIAYLMTGRIATDRTDAAFYQAYDVAADEWCWELIDAAGIRRDIFPKVLDSADIVGKLTPEAAEKLGLTAGISVVAGAGDGAAGSLGCGAVRAGIGNVAFYRTIGFAAVTDSFAPDPLGRLTMGPHVVKGLYAIGGPMNGTVSMDWINSMLFGDRKSYPELDKLVANVPAGSGGVTFLPYLQGERAPWWNSEARGVFAGMSMNTGRAELVKAVMEGVGYNLELMHRIIRRLTAVDMLIVSGEGAESEEWTGIIADILGVDIYQPTARKEANSFGAALIGGVGIGWYEDYSVSLEMLGVSENVCGVDRTRHAEYQRGADAFERAYSETLPVVEGMKAAFN